MASVHVCVLALLVGAFAGTDLGGSTVLLLSCAGILMFGLPHGALDIALLRHSRARTDLGVAALLAVYVVVAAAVAMLWWLAPLVALAMFLAVAVVHFAEDWPETESRFLAIGLALGIVFAPALLHRGEAGAIFVAMTGTPHAARLADMMLLAAPLGCVLALAGIVALLCARRFDRAAAAATSLAAMIMLPPALGFAIYFGLFHSPRHLRHVLQDLGMPRARQWLPRALPALLGAGALVVLLYRANETVVAGALGLGSATFMALAILTVPHMVVPRLVAALPRWRSALAGPRLPCSQRVSATVV